jgi:hypothetical protein
MSSANPTPWSPGLILEAIVFFVMVSLILFAITLIGVGGFYLLRSLGRVVRGTASSGLRERQAASRESGGLARLALVCGPLLGLFLCLLILPVAVIGRLDLREYAKLLPVMAGVGVLAGIIGGGAFWASSSLFGTIRKTVKKWRRGGVWDPEFDGLA